MTGVVASLQVLVAAMAASMLLARSRRAALLTAVIGVLTASVLSIAAALPVLLGADPTPTAAFRWPLPLGAIHLALDALSAWFLLTIAVVSGCVAVYSVAYMTSPSGRAAHPVFGVLLCGLTASFVLVVCAADAVVFLIGWEMMTVTAFLAVAYDHERAEVRSGAWLYLTATHIGTALCVLPLFGLLTTLAGTTEFSQYSSAAQGWSARTLVILFVLAVLGFGTKAGFMPMHVWLPAAHPVAPTPVSALLSGVAVKMGIYGLLRLLSWLPPLPAGCAYLLLIIAVVSGVMGVLYALAQHDLKRLLAYHTVENIGIIALGISVGMLGQATGHAAVAVLGYAGALLHVANHALFKGLLFLSAGAVLRGAGTTDIERLGGLAKSTPINAGLFLVGAVAICGLPPLNGFVSEWVVYGGLFGGAIHGTRASAAVPALGLVALALMGGLALACFAKVYGVVFLGEPRDSRVRAERTPALMRIGMGGLALACVAIGLAPGLWLPLVYRASDALAGSDAVSAAAPALRNILAPASTLSLLAATLVAWLVGLALLRRWLAARTAWQYPTGAADVGTWGCSYSQPTPRMQYSASSFVACLVGCFRHLLWPQRELHAPHGLFPRAGHLETSAPDLALRDLLAPVFRGVARLFTMVRTVSWNGVASAPVDAAPPGRAGPMRVLLTGVVGALRRGNIQVHLAFIVLTLLAVFVIETVSSPAAGGQSAPGEFGAASLRIEP